MIPFVNDEREKREEKRDEKSAGSECGDLRRGRKTYAKCTILRRRNGLGATTMDGQRFIVGADQQIISVWPITHMGRYCPHLQPFGEYCYGKFVFLRCAIVCNAIDYFGILFCQERSASVLKLRVNNVRKGLARLCSFNRKNALATGGGMLPQEVPPNGRIFHWI